MSSRQQLLDIADDGTWYELAHTDDDGNLMIELRENCEPIIEGAKILSDMTPGKEFRHAAVIPKFVMDRAYREGWANDPKAWKRWANDADNRMFRTWPGYL